MSEYDIVQDLVPLFFSFLKCKCNDESNDKKCWLK